MKLIDIMINGMPGNVASITASHIAADNRLNLLPFSMTGAEIEAETHIINSLECKLIKPGNIETILPELTKKYPDMIAVDFTHPTAVNKNGQIYTKFNIPFVMGTTGGDREALKKSVESSSISAVIAPNMAKQIVGFQAMMEYAADNFPDLFKGYTLKIKESHQKGKADTSGTAKAMVKYYNKLGVSFSEDDIIMERDPEIQKDEWNIPEKYLTGHAWHTYTLTSHDNSSKFEFSHNINGREIYAEGTIDAILFLYNQIKRQKEDNMNKKGVVYTMIDVLKGFKSSKF